MRRLLPLAILVGFIQFGFSAEYNVREPSDVLRPKYHAADTVPGVWTLNVDDALAKAKAAGKCTLLLNTASWWCPFCETLEDLVLKTPEWAEFVAEKGFYLAMLDFPYRGTVPREQQYKSWHPELGTGWGFKCWLMSASYLAEIGLTQEEGLDAIMGEYQRQKELAKSDASCVVISNWQGTAEFSYGKVGYPTLFVIGSDGQELGRFSFPWSSPSAVTESEAREYVMQAIEVFINGKCELCRDPVAGSPITDAAQTYNGWLSTAREGISGTVQLKTSKRNARGLVWVSGSITVSGRKTVLTPVAVSNLDEVVTLTKGDFSVSVRFGTNGIGGAVYVAGTQVYTIAGGGRDIFRARDAQAVARRAESPVGCWGVVIKSAESDDPDFARGYGGLSIELKKGGSVNVVGSFGDGTRVTGHGRLIVGDDEMSCVPIQLTAYGRKGGLGFVVWFKKGKLLSFTDVTKWVIAGKRQHESQVTLSATMSPGKGTIPGEQELTLVNFNPDMTIGGMPLVYDPSDDVITVSRRLWSGSETSRFRAVCNDRTGVLRGQMVFLVMANNCNKFRKSRAVFSGVVMGGSGYGTVVTRDGCAWPVRVAVCGSCSD